MYNILISILLVFLVLVCLLMIIAVLMQRPRSEGLGAAFGGGMTENLFGAQTTHILQKFTVWLGGAFFGITLLLAILYARASAGQTQIQKELMSQPDAPAATAPAVTTPAMPSTPSAPSVDPVAPAPVVPVEPDAPVSTSAPAQPAQP